MNRLTLYTNPMSRGRIARWMLEETGQPYEVVVLDYATTMKEPAYLAINPMGKVPALTHGDRVVTEGAAICTYLADAFPEAGLMPEDRAGFYRWMFFGAGPLEAAVTNAALQVVVPAERRGMVGYGSLEKVVATLSGHLAGQPYFLGSQFTAVDVYVGSQISWGLQFGTLPADPVLADYAARITARPAALRAKAADDALLGPKP
ncbi:glutathione S-transferase family protein [Gemmobacter denitrificans]|uniref:Glutathione S-transferase family protein n=1 Tax=Gemmobacter denitrificans TaxID=3123040 RepID=A0ABU8BTC2_9RHOB